MAMFQVAIAAPPPYTFQQLWSVTWSKSWFKKNSWWKQWPRDGQLIRKRQQLIRAQWWDSCRICQQLIRAPYDCRVLNSCRIRQQMRQLPRAWQLSDVPTADPCTRWLSCARQLPDVPTADTNDEAVAMHVLDSCRMYQQLIQMMRQLPRAWQLPYVPTANPNDEAVITC
jgi:hypothetical protein